MECEEARWAKLPPRQIKFACFGEVEDDGDLDKEYDEDLDEVFQDDDANSDIENEDEKEGAPNDDIVI